MKTMRKNKGLKKRGKGLALGICAAILGTVGVAWIPQTVAWAYAESYMDADGKMVTKVFQNGDTDTVTDETDEVTAAEAENAGKSGFLLYSEGVDGIRNIEIPTGLFSKL